MGGDGQVGRVIALFYWDVLERKKEV